MNQTHTNENKALIIGCGIAGMTLAMFLQKAGITPSVYEKHPQPKDEAGFFLNLSPNGLAVLNTLGLKDKVTAHGTPTTRTIFQNHNGKKLGENLESTLLLKRGLLTKALRKAAIERGVTIEFGKQLGDVEITGEHTVTAYFEDGSQMRGNFLVGCDGIHSQTRRSVMPNAPQPEYLGIIDSGGFAQNPSIPASEGLFRMTFGAEGFFGYQATPSGEIYWFENFAQKAEPDQKQLQAIPKDEWQTKLINIHRDDHDPVTKIIRSTEGEIGKWPNYEVPPLPAWHQGPVCLIGDAAHAMSPAAGQGASMAIEDAAVLAKCLRDIPNVEKAFSTFEQLRKNRVEKIAKAARRNSDQKGPTNALTRWIRDLVLPFFLKMGVKGARRTHEYRVDWDEKVGLSAAKMSR